MKKLLLILSLFLYVASHTAGVFAQEYEDLLILYVDEKYDKCFDKSVKYTTKDDHKKNPLPYLYASMASYEMSQDHKYSDVYPKAYKTALSYAGKYRKKDKTYAYKEDSEEYIELLKMTIMEEVDNYMLEGTEKAWKKAVGLMKKVCTFDPVDPGAILLRGHLEILTKNKSEGKTLIKEGMARVKAIGADLQFGDMTLSQQVYFKKALIIYAEAKNRKDPIAAKEIISLGQQFFYEKRQDCLIEDNEDFKTVYDKITG